MVEWLMSNMATIIVSVVIALIVAAILICRIKARRAGKSTCGCGCSHCPMSEQCHSRKK